MTTRQHGEHINAWRAAALEAITKHPEGLTAKAVVIQVGAPPGGMSPNAVLNRLIESNECTMAKAYGANRYVATGRPAQHVSGPKPPFLPHLGRDFPRVPSIFHLAQGVTA